MYLLFYKIDNYWFGFFSLNLSPSVSIFRFHLFLCVKSESGNLSLLKKSIVPSEKIFFHSVSHTIWFSVLKKKSNILHFVLQRNFVYPSNEHLHNKTVTMERLEIYVNTLSHNVTVHRETNGQLNKSCQEVISSHFTPSRQLTSHLAFTS